MFDIANMPSSVNIGFVGENDFREIEIDMTKWMEKMPDGVPSIVHIRPGETKADAYIVATTFADNVLTWTVSMGDLGEREGSGIAQVWLEKEENDTVIKRGMSITFATQIHDSISDASEEAPAAQESWLQQMTALKTATVNAKADAESARDAAESAQALAESAQTAAETAEINAEAAETNATAAQTAAETAQTAAEAAQTAAELAQTGAEAAETNAASAQSAAESAQSAAESAQAAAETAQAAAEAAQAAAAGSATAAASSATAAAGSESEAELYATTASQKALAASDSALASYTSALVSGQKSNAAAASATAAAASETDAAASATAAETAQTAAETAQGKAEDAQEAAETAQAAAEDAQEAAETAQAAAEAAAESIEDSAAQIATNKADISSLKSATNNKFELTETKTTVNRPDATGHSLVATEAVRFWDTIIPENALIETVEIPIGGLGGTPYLYISVWELNDAGTTLTKVKTVSAELSANSNINVPIWHKSNKKRYISQIQHNCQIYYLSNQTGHSFLLANGSTAETETLILSELWNYSNMYLVGTIEYSEISDEIVVNDKITTKKVDLPWRHGAVGNNGEVYASIYPIMTDLFIPTDKVDRFNFAVDSGVNAIIAYFNNVNGEFVYKTSATIYYGYTHTINKSYDSFIIRLFKDWSTIINPNDGNNIINAYKDFYYSDIEKYAYDIEPVNYKRIIEANLKKRNLDFISIAHQGFSYTEIPNHNLQPGYVEAANRGFDYGETDLRLTSDNVLVCCHDDSFVDATSGVTVNIADHTYTELEQYNYYGGKIASFDSIVKTCKENGIGILIDQLTVDRLPYAIQTITKYGMWSKTKWFVVYYPDYPTAIADYTTPILAANREASLFVVAQYDVDAAINFAKTIKTPYNEVIIHLPYTNYTVQDLIDLLPQMGGELGFSVYTIDNLTEYKEYMPYVKAIISNQISTVDVIVS